MAEPPLILAEEVRAALADGRAVVALESSILTHGMPYPENLTTAQAVEAAVRRAAAVPATIAVVAGRLRVGLDPDTLERLARNRNAEKASRRDLAVLLARRSDAGTTVAATMATAAMAGIAVFATGGIGGVHRGAAESFDISADLLALARTPVAVVCAGAKSILDIPKTLEVLETHGVPVVGYRTDTFPAFFVRTSGAKLDHRLETPEAIADVIAAQRALGEATGLLVANPIPEEAAIPAETVDAAIAAACREAADRGIAGKALTPFLLARVNALTEGQSLAANIALVKNNAALAGWIAAALAERQSPRRKNAAL